MNPNTRIIKKYSNRRLYDTTKRSYITLEDIKTLVLAHADFRVLDADSQADITKSTLLQIINDQEETAAPIFTIEVLQHLIRSYNNNIQNLLSQYLEQAMGFFIEQQETYKNHQATYATLSQNPLVWMNNLLDMQKNFLSSLAPGFASEPMKKTRTKSTTKKSDHDNK